MKNKLFTLTRRNQKGQVAIFVALIFQVIFVFFAILINIGLLVHHKINLQQSTDLAAYYGAMKQAELMNAIAHVNFQMRQAWKLLTWRYRVVGTFGFQDAPPRGQSMMFPLTIDTGGTNPTVFNGLAAETTKCPTTGVNILDVPFFCGGHSGFGTWRAQNENNCRVDCGHVQGLQTSIAAIPLTTGYDNPFSGGVAGAVNGALNQANTQIANLCDDLGPSGFASLAKYIIAYSNEVQKKKKLIQMLGASLSARPNVMVDLNGGAIEAGATKTFDNNLTDANIKGKISFATINGLTQGGSECPFQGDAGDGAGEDGRSQFLKEIRIQGVQYFIHRCLTTGGGGSKDFVPGSMFSDGALQQIDTRLFPASLSAADRENLRQAIANTEYIIGYEKNPWCQVYYGAKAQSEPKIPFLPLSKIRLSAISVAKPFGGTIGPRYHAYWPTGNPTSSGGPKVDATLPERRFSGVAPGPPLVQYQAILPNYANYVGDVKGLKDAFVVGAYQEMLLYRQLNRSIPELNISVDKEAGAQAGSAVGLQQPPAPNGWPDYANWFDIDPNTPGGTHDYIAKNRTRTSNSFLRDLEIAVVAPNQFDMNYYSIDPDFYNNYYLKIVGGSAGPLNFGGGSYSRLLSAARGNGPSSAQDIDPDYGYNRDFESANRIARGYSVRHQIAVANYVVKNSTHVIPSFGRPNTEIFQFKLNKPSSLLSGWTFQDFSHYVDAAGTNFPSAAPSAANTMTFGKCNDENWNNTSDLSIERNFDSPVSTNLPPTPGNCVTGGRTGYSVKIVAPSLLRNGAPPQDFGGGGAAGNILNPIENSFFTF